tara:strand:- start:2176 stop:2562 length:387 start_codon:yes stop_codon:yes gene_type:complete
MELKLESPVLSVEIPKITAMTTKDKKQIYSNFKKFIREYEEELKITEDKEKLQDYRDSLDQLMKSETERNRLLLRQLTNVLEDYEDNLDEDDSICLSIIEEQYKEEFSKFTTNVYKLREMRTLYITKD